MENVIDPVTESGGEPQDTGTDIVGDGKQYKDVSELAKGKLQADEHITKVEGENAQLREAIKELEGKATQAKGIDDILSAIEAKRAAGDTQGPTATPEDITELVAKALNKQQSDATADTNKTKVNTALIAKFDGDSDKAVAFVLETRQSLGMSADQLDVLSKNSPEAALRLFGVEAKKQTTGPTSASSQSTINAEALAAQTNSGVRNQAYYSALRKEMGMGKFYADIKIQNQMYSDAQDQGDKFHE